MKKHINLSEDKYITSDDLETYNSDSDIYVTGSDQVWNSEYNEGIDEGFFLRFAHMKPKISFASSFGKEKLDAWEIGKTKQYLADYDAISVRELQGVNIVENLGYQATCLMDPTLQIPKEDWISLASDRIIEDKYIVLFLLYNEDEGATEYARKIADLYGYKLVKISWELFKDRRVDILMTHKSPEDFLSLLYYAELIITNSFHGIAFSINLNKEFIAIPRKKFNSRLESILNITNLTNRFVKNHQDGIHGKINYEKVNQLLDCEREKTINFINDAVNSISEKNKVKKNNNFNIN